MDRPTGPLDSADLTFDVIDGWPDGVPIDGEYAEHYLLGLVGPTPLWLARFAVREAGHTWTLPDAGRAVGVHPRNVRDAGRRLERFGMAAWLGGPQHYVLQVARMVRPLADPRTLPPALLARHEAVTR